MGNGNHTNNVFSFWHWVYGQELLDISEPCSLPFHKEEYITTGKYCARCWVQVKLVDHPSMDEPQWFGQVNKN